MDKQFSNREIEMVVACHPKCYKQYKYPTGTFWNKHRCKWVWMGSNRWCKPHCGIWSTPGKVNHINFLELLTTKHALVNYKKMWKNSKHNRVKSDNTTAIAYVNKVGSTVLNSCNHLVREIWKNYIASKVWLTAVHMPGEKNITADFMLKLQNVNTERILIACYFS